jgi:hypothetical protein
LRGRVAPNGPWQIFELGASTTILNTGNILSPGTAYQVQVRAYCNQAKTLTTPWSTTLNFTTTGTPAAQGIWGTDASILYTQVYPNPNNGTFQAIVHNAADDFTVAVRDIAGRQVYTKRYAASMAGTLIDVNIESAARGIYFLQIQAGEAQHVEKLVVR